MEKGINGGGGGRHLMDIIKKNYITLLVFYSLHTILFFFEFHATFYNNFF